MFQNSHSVDDLSGTAFVVTSIPLLYSNKTGQNA